jgi:hypothetical protein
MKTFTEFKTSIECIDYPLGYSIECITVRVMYFNYELISISNDTFYLFKLIGPKPIFKLGVFSEMFIEDIKTVEIKFCTIFKFF